MKRMKKQKKKEKYYLCKEIEERKRMWEDRKGHAPC